LGFNMWQKRETPGEGFPLALRAMHPSKFVQQTSEVACNFPCALERKKRVSLSAESDQRRRLWNPPPFEKGGPKLYHLVWNFTDGKDGRTQFAPTIRIFIIDLEFAPQQTPPLPKGWTETLSFGVEFNQWQKRANTVRPYGWILEFNGWRVHHCPVFWTDVALQ